MPLQLHSTPELENEAAALFAQTIETNRLVNSQAEAERAGADLIEALVAASPGALLMIRDATRALNAIVHVAIDGRGGDWAIGEAAVADGSATWVDLEGEPTDAPSQA